MEPRPERQSDSAKELLAAHRRDKRREAKFNILIGALFIVWTIFDVATGFFEEMWYVNVFFGALGLAILVFGILQARSYRGDGDNSAS